MERPKKILKGRKSIMNKKRIPIFSIILYVVAGLLVLYTAWTLVHSIEYISAMIAQGQLVVGGNEYDIINFYMSNCAQYLLFAIIIFVLGWILQKNSYGKASSACAEVQASLPEGKADGDDFKDWLKTGESKDAVKGEDTTPESSKTE